MQASITREPNYGCAPPPPTATERETFREMLSDRPEGEFLSPGQLLRWSLVEPTARNVASRVCVTSSRWLRRGRARSSPLVPPPPNLPPFFPSLCIRFQAFCRLSPWISDLPSVST